MKREVYEKECESINIALQYFQQVVKDRYGIVNDHGQIVYDRHTGKWKAGVGYEHGPDHTAWIVWEADDALGLTAQITTDVFTHITNKNKTR